MSRYCEGDHVAPHQVVRRDGQLLGRVCPVERLRGGRVIDTVNVEGAHGGVGGD